MHTASSACAYNQIIFVNSNCLNKVEKFSSKTNKKKSETVMAKVKKAFSYTKKTMKLSFGKQYYQVSNGYMDFANFQNHFILQQEK